MILENSPKNNDASWPRSIAVINICLEEHGDNHYKCNEKNQLLKHLTFITTIKGEQENLLHSCAAKRANYIHCMETLAQNGSAETALDFMQSEANKKIAYLPCY